MSRFLFKCLLLGVVFFLGVLYGQQMDHADDTDSHLTNPIPSNSLINGASQKYVNIEQQNRTSQTGHHPSFGHAFSKQVTLVFRGGVTAVSDVIENIFINDDPDTRRR